MRRRDELGRSVRFCEGHERAKHVCDGKIARGPGEGGFQVSSKYDIGRAQVEKAREEGEEDVIER